MNVADQITQTALKFPYKRAVVATSGKDAFGNYRYVHYTFIELEKKINQFANALKDSGMNKGDKTLLFIRPCLDFSALAFALFKIGAVPVFIDPGMGRKKFLEAVKNCSPRVLIGIPKALVLKRIFSKYFSSVKFVFNYGKRGFLGAPSIVSLSNEQSFEAASESMAPNELGAVLFTSGGTGRPKGVVYTHEIFIAQTRSLQEEFNLNENDVDAPGFPLFALFTLSMGMTSCIPDMDPSNPAKADPKALIQIIKDQSVTFAAGSPAIWQNLALYCFENKMTLPTLKYLVMFGAPVSLELHKLFKKVLPNGDTFTPYGATESLPVSNAKGSVILERFAEKTLEGAGVYIGRPLKEVDVKIIQSTERP
ncbi:MAG: AMP-binding protein, partial [Bacteriovoracaceae bacterium]